MTVEKPSYAGAIKRFIERDSRPVTLPEITAFRKACNESEWQEMGEQALLSLSTVPDAT